MTSRCRLIREVVQSNTENTDCRSGQRFGLLISPDPSSQRFGSLLLFGSCFGDCRVGEPEVIGFVCSQCDNSGAHLRRSTAGRRSVPRPDKPYVFLDRRGHADHLDRDRVRWIATA
jgi:hypothetical protein